MHRLRYRASRFPRTIRSGQSRGLCPIDQCEAFQDSLDDIVTGSIRYRFKEQETFATQQARALRRLKRKYPEVGFRPLEPMILDELIHWPEG